MFTTIVILLVVLIFVRYGVPFIFIAIAGTIIKDDALARQNKQNITSARNNGYSFSALHVIERLLIYTDMFCLGVIIFFPMISAPFALGLFVIVFIQIFECIAAMKNGSAYTWVFASMFKSRIGQSGVYNNTINGNVGGLFKRNNGYNSGYNRNNGYNSMNHRNSSNYINSYNGINNRNTAGRNNYDGRNKNLNGAMIPVDAIPIENSKTCFLTVNGVIQYTRNDRQYSVKCVNVSDDVNTTIYMVQGNDIIDTLCKELRGVKPTIVVSSGKMSTKLFINSLGNVIGTMYPDSMSIIMSSFNGYVIKQADTDYYVCEFKDSKNYYISTIYILNDGYAFKSVSDKSLIEILLDKEFNPIQDVDKCKEESGIDIVSGIKDAFGSIPNKTALKIKAKELLHVLPAGIGKDGVYNDGTVDVMCEFGELVVIEEYIEAPAVQSVIVCKLLPAVNINDVIKRIGDGWSDADLDTMLDDMLNTIKDVSGAKCINHWITDDKNIYYLSVVYNTCDELTVEVLSRLHNICKSTLIKDGVSNTNNLGYRYVVCSADNNKLINNRNSDEQSYYNINTISTSPNIFMKKLNVLGSEVNSFRIISKLTGLTFRASVLGTVSYDKDSDGTLCYASRVYIPKSVIFDWEREKVVMINKIKSTTASPAKLRDTLKKAYSVGVSAKYAPIFAIMIEDDNDMQSVNFLYTDEVDCINIDKCMFDTPLMAYICYDRLEKYLLDQIVDKEIKVVMFKKKKENKNNG